MEPKDLLFSVVEPKALANTVNMAFSKFVASDEFCDLPEKDRAQFLFNWEILRDFLSASEFNQVNKRDSWNFSMN